MKKLFAIISLLTFSLLSFAQNTSTRNDVNGDYSSNVIGYQSVSRTDAASSTLDTLDVRPAKAVTYYKVTITDSAAFRLKSAAGMYKGDKVIIDVINPAQTGVFALLGNFVVSTGTYRIALTASKRCHLELYFDGKNLVETSRNLNYTY